MDDEQDGFIVDASGCEVDDLVYCGAVRVTVAADRPWAVVVGRAVQSGWVGIEATGSLSGSVSDVVATNGTCHGQSVADVVDSVRTWDRALGAQRTFAAADCGFGPGGSDLQEALDDGTPRFDVLDATFLFRHSDLSGPVTDQEVAALLGITPGERVSLEAVWAATRQELDQASVTG